MRLHLGWLALLLAAGCGDPRITSPFVDSFERAEIGSDYLNTGGPYRIVNGQLVFSRAHNHPLWLKRRLPDNVRIDLDCMAKGPEGDVKVEAYGDGKSYESPEAVEKDLIYTATGYVFIFGGWHNRLSTLVKQNEHAWQQQPGVPTRTAPKVEPNRMYHWTIIRRAGHLEWLIDGQPFLEYEDPEPLFGPGHDHFGFTGWESEVAFDNLKITPL